eukprot:6204378-Pleurochrysis_carterae.AAC.1
MVFKLLPSWSSGYAVSEKNRLLGCSTFVTSTRKSLGTVLKHWTPNLFCCIYYFYTCTTSKNRAERVLDTNCSSVRSAPVGRWATLGDRAAVHRAVVRRATLRERTD